MTYDPRRDDLLFQSAQSDGKGGFVQPSASPDPRDALIAELCEALDALNHIISKVTHTSGGRRYNSYQDFVDLNEKGLGEALEQASAALRRARGLA